jgi:hypothetical protein
MNIEDPIYAASTAETWGPRIIYRAAEDRNRGRLHRSPFREMHKKTPGLTFISAWGFRKHSRWRGNREAGYLSYWQTEWCDNQCCRKKTE